jgi:predicted MPP superfamily phosphohydrolase
MPSRRQFLAGCAALCASAIPASWYAAVYEPNALEVVRRQVPIRGLPAALDGLRCVQLSDLHITRVTDLHLRAVQQANALRPDLVFVTGDLVDVLAAVPDVVELLRGLSPPLGILAVPGNWDHTAEAIDGLRRLLPSAGAQLLVNEHRLVEQGLCIVGVDDPATWHDHLSEALDGAPDSAARLLLAHSPEIAYKLDHDGFGLILTGHTHGGQINLPFLNGAWLHSGHVGPYVAGQFEVDDSPLYVNRGIGTTTVPVRIAASPEVTEFTLRAT